MIHLNFALSLERLADSLILEIGRHWSDPFDAPVIIFPDKKLEEWFWLRWVRQKGVLANLNAMTFDRFLGELLLGDEEGKLILSDGAFLRNVLVAHLLAETGGEANYKAIPDVRDYLETEGELDYARLFDFAGKLSTLFFEYERNRPSGFLAGREGILDCWKEGKLRDFFSVANPELARMEEWQRGLYSTLFHKHGGEDSLLTKAFSEFKNGETTYLTIPYVYEQKKACLKWSHGAVFIFGLAGMGKLYRVILQKFAESHEVYAYIQNPCMEFWEDCYRENSLRRWSKKTEPAGIALPGGVETGEELGVRETENTLLKNWGRTGRENVRLWCLAADYDFSFEGDLPQREARTLLSTVQEMVARRSNECGVKLENDDSLTLTAAPSKLREVEALHSRVCKLLQGGVRLDEMLVLAPNIDDYRTPIQQVFDPAVLGKSPGTELRFPYKIIDFPESASMISAALASLSTVRETGSVTRVEFFALVKNPVVQAVRGITQSDVEAWQNWTEAMNVYREGDWLLGVRRLLLARLSEENFCLDGSVIVPYSDIESAADETLAKFVKCIKDLERFAASPKTIRREDLEQIREALKSWLGLGNVTDLPELHNEKALWQRLVLAIEDLDLFFCAGVAEVPWTIIASSLAEGLSGGASASGRLFSGGLSFMGFAPNRTIPVKHLFILGLNEEAFPGSSDQNTLDLRRYARWPGDDSRSDKNRYEFLCELMNAAEGFHLSYVNMDLKKDAELYPSSVVRDLQLFLRNAGLDFREEEITLDEIRDDSEIWTLRELRAKELHQNLLKNATAKKDEAKPELKLASQKIEVVKLHEFKSFLNDPFEFQVSNRVKLDEAEGATDKQAFENVDLDALDEAVCLKELFSKAFDAAKRGEDFNRVFGKALEAYFVENRPLRGIFAEAEKRDLLEAAGQMFALVKESIASWKEFEFGVEFEQRFGFWQLGGKADWLRRGKNDIELFTIKRPEKKSKPQTKSFLPLYLQALLVAATIQGEAPSKNLNCTLDILLYRPDLKEGNRRKIFIKTFTLKPGEAQARLENICHACFRESYAKVVPFNLITSKAEAFASLGEYRKKILDEEWKYYSGRDLFNLDEVCGFTAENFAPEWLAAVEKMRGLIGEPAIYTEEESKTKKEKKK